VPTITAVGVASPKAHGQAIHKTVIAVRNANSKITSVLLVNEDYKTHKYILETYSRYVTGTETRLLYLHIYSKEL
jgi:hypothetical protein